MTDTDISTRSTGRERLDRLGLDLVDADNHYYEAPDAFTRHLPSELQTSFRWVTLDDGGKRRLVVNGRLQRGITNPTFDPISKPGALQEMFKHEGSFDYRKSGDDLEPLRVEYQDRDARLAAMDDQRVDKAWLFPTLAVAIEHLLYDDRALHTAALSAFNRWMDDDWGLNYRDRIYAIPCFTLHDVDWAVRELDWALERGARLVHLISGPVPGAAHGRSPADPAFDPFWARVDEAGVTVALHSCDSGYYKNYSTEWGEMGDPPTHLISRFQMVTCMYRPVQDMIAAMVLHGLFARFPRVRVVSVENGGFWAGFLLKNLGKVRHRSDFGRTHEDPVELFRRHVYIEPFAEESASELAELIGTDHVVFGSDWPHPEGTVEPAAFFDDLAELSDEDVRRIGRQNALDLMGEPR
jgi:predicted TIM-barrel fold metal-dependent hydrolase